MFSKKINLILILLVFVASQQLFAATKNLRPYLHNKIVKVKTGDKEPTAYYTLSKKFATNLKVGGPGRVTLYLRSEVKEGKATSEPFSLKYTVDGKKVRVKKINPIEVSKKSKVIGWDGKISVVKKVIFTVPPGKHVVDFLIIGNKGKVYSKYLFEKFPDPQWKSQPLSKSSEEVILISTKKNKERKYHRISSTKSIKLKAKEKSYLRIQFRAEFKAYMFSDNTLRLHIKENGKIIKTIQISSTRAKYTVYKGGGKLVPGTLNKFYMTVPKGEHEYEIVVADTSKTALVKVSYDQKRYPKKKK